MKSLAIALYLLVIGFPLAAGAGHGSGHSSGAHSHVSNRSGRVYGFATSTCKSAACKQKHPSGTYVHPLTSSKHAKAPPKS